MPQARKVVHRSTARIVGAIPLPLKNSELIEWESTLERDAILIFGFCPAVTFIQSQPIKFEYLDSSNKVGIHYPDFRVDLGPQKYLIEIKEESQLRKYQERTTLMKIQAPLQGYEYLILDESVLRIQPRLNNIALLMRYRALRPTDELISAAAHAFSKKTNWTIAELMKQHDIIDVVAIYTLLVNYLITMDLHTTITASSTVRLCYDKEEALPREEIFS
jgi:hypothetical protein